MNRIRVLLAEDHETVREGLRLLLQAQQDLDVVGEVSDGRRAVEQARALRPHVVVLDISMPELNGFAAAQAIKRGTPEVAIVALTRHDDDAFVQELMDAGVSAYVLKQSPSTVLLKAVRAAAGGDRYLDPVLLARRARATEERGSPRGQVISDREKSVLRMMAIGHSNKEIAATLHISVKTVEVHKANAMRKLGLRGRIDVVRLAMLRGWLTEPPG
jgi:DNA-binding NarL/FixJ family response regulator